MNFYRLMMGSASAAMASMLAANGGKPLPPEVQMALRRSDGATVKRDWTKTKSRYWPHQGKRECARRVEQMNRATLRAVNKRVAS